MTFCSAQILSDLDWSNLAQRWANHLEKLMFKTMNNQELEYISEKFVLRNSIHNRNLRGSDHICTHSDICFHNQTSEYCLFLLKSILFDHKYFHPKTKYWSP